ncbi:hypothetical protein ABPG73_012864 [Tetrahymena malaccensis]
MQMYIQDLKNLENRLATQNLSCLEINLNCSLNESLFSGICCDIRKQQNLLKLKISLIYPDQINDKNLSQISSAIASCSQLEYLRSNQIAQDFQDLLSALTQFKKLRNLTLDLENSNLGVKHAKDLGSALVNLNQLSNLSVQICKSSIGDEGVKDLCLNLEKCSKIQQLSLIFEQNKFGAKGAQAIGISLGKHVQLTDLTLSFIEDQISDDAILGLSNAIKNKANLKTLNLELKVSAVGVKYLRDCLSTCTSLCTLKLDIRFTEKGSKNVADLIQGLESLTNLQTLDILFIGNDYAAQGLTFLVPGLANCSKLLDLHLSLRENQIGGTVSICSAIQNCINLQSLILELDENQIGDKGLKSLFQDVSKFTNLTYLIILLCNCLVKDTKLQKKCDSKLLKMKKLVFGYISYDFD